MDIFFRSVRSTTELLCLEIGHKVAHTLEVIFAALSDCAWGKIALLVHVFQASVGVNVNFLRRIRPATGWRSTSCCKCIFIVIFYALQNQKRFLSARARECRAIYRKRPWC